MKKVVMLGIIVIGIVFVICTAFHHGYDVQADFQKTQIKLDFKKQAQQPLKLVQSD